MTNEAGNIAGLHDDSQDQYTYKSDVYAIRQDFSNYCQSCREGNDPPENQRFREESPIKIDLLLNYIDYLEHKLTNVDHKHICWCSNTYPGCESVLHFDGRYCTVCKQPMKNRTELKSI